MITRKARKLATGRMTRQECARIAELAEQGKTAMEIAIALNRAFGTVNSYIHRHRRNGLEVRLRYAFWRDEEDAVLTDMVRRGATDAAIGEALGRSKDAVHSRLMYLGGRELILYPQAPDRPLPKIEATKPQPQPERTAYLAWRIAMARVARRQSGTHTSEATHV